MLETLRTIEEQSLLQTSLMSDEMFILPLKSEANMSVWAQDGVNRALCDNLIDDNVLGTDYTKPVTRDQLRSIMTRLVKEMTGKDATAAAIGRHPATKRHRHASGACSLRAPHADVYRAEFRPCLFRI